MMSAWSKLLDELSKVPQNLQKEGHLLLSLLKDRFAPSAIQDGHSQESAASDEELQGPFAAVAAELGGYFEPLYVLAGDTPASEAFDFANTLRDWEDVIVSSNQPQLLNKWRNLLSVHTNAGSVGGLQQSNGPQIKAFAAAWLDFCQCMGIRRDDIETRVTVTRELRSRYFVPPGTPDGSEVEVVYCCWFLRTKVLGRGRTGRVSC